MHFKKIARYFELESFSNRESLLLLHCLKQIAFFGSLDELKMYQLCKLIIIRMSKQMFSIICKGATNCQSFCIAKSMQQILWL